MYRELSELAAYMASGSVGFYNGANGRVIQDGIWLPSGLAVTTDSRYVAGWTGVINLMLIHFLKENESRNYFDAKVDDP